MTYVLILVGCVFVNNVVLSQFMGICAFLGVSKQLKSSAGMGAAVIFVMICATAITYPLYKLLEHFEMTYLKTIAFILVIAVLVQLVEMAQSLTNALGTGLAFTLALLLFSGVRSRIEDNDFPQAFKGVPATLIAAAIVSVSFMGFAGMM